MEQFKIGELFDPEFRKLTGQEAQKEFGIQIITHF